MINWEVIMWTCITIAVLVGIVSMILLFISAKNIKKRTSEIRDFHLDLKPGSKVMFCGGVYGKIVRIETDTVDVEVAKNVVLTVSRYAVQSIA